MCEANQEHFSINIVVSYIYQIEIIIFFSFFLFLLVAVTYNNQHANHNAFLVTKLCLEIFINTCKNR